MIRFLKKNWFMTGLVTVSLLVLGDSTGTTVKPGLWLKNNHGPDFFIILVFFLSGLALDIRQIREGFYDYRGTITSLGIIFIAAPLTALMFTFLPLSSGIIIGLFLVGVMPSTLSSGVVMTGAAGGNMAHALFITILANSLAVVTIPATLTLLLSFVGDSRSIEIDQFPIMMKIGTLVLVPLILGILLRTSCPSMVKSILPNISTINQAGILAVVWMAACQGREVIVASIGSIPVIIATVFCFHLVLIFLGLGAARTMHRGKGCRESVIMMGGQKTLPLSLILQVSLFPEYGLAIVVCVLHHITHLAMDGFLVQYLKDQQ